MKWRIALAIGTIVFFLAAATSVLWLRSAVVATPEPIRSESPAHSAAIDRDGLAIAAADDARRAKLAAAFAELQASRKLLQQQLGDLKSILWGRELPADQARSIIKDMMSAQYLLKDPPLLGAFSETNEIFAEKDRADAARLHLQEISRAMAGPKAQ